MGITEFIVQHATNFIHTTGYWGVGVLMTFESMVLPVPSEAVMPFAGFLWFQGTMTFWAIVFFATLGSIIGSLISYAIGFYGGRPLILKFGKFLLLNEHDLEKTEQFFQRRGGIAVFFSRFIPVVRHLISIPAGLGKMPLKRFILYTAVGAGLWNAFLAYVGFQLGNNWKTVEKYSKPIDWAMLALLILALIWYIRHIRRRRKIAILSS